MNKRTFFKFSGTASSYRHQLLAVVITRIPEISGFITYKTVSLSTVHEAVHYIDDFKPEIQHAVPLGEQH